jgi:hypothetical protein
LTEESTNGSTAYEEVELSADEGADQLNEVQSFRNVTNKTEEIMVPVILNNHHHIEYS